MLSRLITHHKMVAKIIQLKYVAISGTNQNVTLCNSLVIFKNEQKKIREENLLENYLSKQNDSIV